MGFIFGLIEDVFLASKEAIKASRENRRRKKHPEYYQNEEKPLFDDFGDMVFQLASAFFSFLTADILKSEIRKKHTDAVSMQIKNNLKSGNFNVLSGVLFDDSQCRLGDESIKYKNASSEIKSLRQGDWLSLR